MVWLGSVIERPTDSTTSTSSGHTDTKSGQTSTKMNKRMDRRVLQLDRRVLRANRRVLRVGKLVLRVLQVVIKCSLNNFPRFYKEIFTRWSKHPSFPVSLPSTIASQFLWFSKDMKVDRKCIYFRDFSKKGLNFLGQLFDLKGKPKNWTTIKNEYHLLNPRAFSVYNW